MAAIFCGALAVAGLAAVTLKGERSRAEVPEDLPLVVKSAATVIRLSGLKPPDIVQTLGYRSEGDGGGAIYRRVPDKPKHRGSLAVVMGDKSIAWYAIQAPASVLSFGALRDGPNSRVAFMRAQQAVDIIVVPHGTYNVGAGIEIANGKTWDFQDVALWQSGQGRPALSVVGARDWVITGRVRFVEPPEDRANGTATSAVQ